MRSTEQPRSLVVAGGRRPLEPQPWLRNARSLLRMTTQGCS
ncbi:hypothetical protein CLIM01_14990 [Colletotrichum limetticola]|uniref:Uncharacterized protein n=1 Tax=Colletotrichum limetticola TaxID=1209924 RepID=A0ABQ9P6E4_9PEZI|nr:hypothetical protein CLIM01_14990 [Colletotrichum limetticola]